MTSANSGSASQLLQSSQEAELRCNTATKRVGARKQCRQSDEQPEPRRHLAGEPRIAAQVPAPMPEKQNAVDYYDLQELKRRQCADGARQRAVQVARAQVKPSHAIAHTRNDRTVASAV